jgi:lysine 2,3-aminomutase
MSGARQPGLPAVAAGDGPPAPGDPGRPARRTARSARDLVAAGAINPARLREVAAVAARFAVAVTPEMLGQMRPGDPGDPIRRQFVPSAEELLVAPEELGDPVGDDAFSPVKGITHRYPDRLLLKPLHVCPVYCRFCFRREKVGPGGEALSAAELEAALGYLRDHREVWEVILTGGDPLMLSPRRLAEILAALAAIEHVEVVRVHTRVPVVDPRRVGRALVKALAAVRPLWVVVHANHAREMTAAACAACARLADAGLPLLGQSVLLKGVNDDPAAMEELLRTLVRNRIKPMYLHHGDLARGTAHLRTGIAEGRELMRSLRGRLSGLCQPTYVLDVPGGHGKVPIGPDYLEDAGGGRWRVEDVHGRRHEYPPLPPGDEGG